MQLSDWSMGVVPDAVNPLLPKATPTLRGKLRDSFHTARGYREVAVEYTCVPDGQYPWDPLMMKLIWEFAPDAVPLWVRWVFRTPQEEENPHDVVFGRHALGRSVKSQRGELHSFRVGMPTMPVLGVTFDKPNTIWFIHEGAVDPDFRELPGNYLPFDHSIVHRAKQMAEGFRMSDKEYREYLHRELIDKRREAHMKRRAAILDDLEYRQRELERYVAGLNISELEAKEFANRARAGY